MIRLLRVARILRVLRLSVFRELVMMIFIGFWGQLIIVWRCRTIEQGTTGRVSLTVRRSTDGGLARRSRPWPSRRTAWSCRRRRSTSMRASPPYLLKGLLSRWLLPMGKSGSAWTLCLSKISSSYLVASMASTSGNSRFNGARLGSKRRVASSRRRHASGPSLRPAPNGRITHKKKARRLASTPSGRRRHRDGGASGAASSANSARLGKFTRSRNQGFATVSTKTGRAPPVLLSVPRCRTR